MTLGERLKDAIKKRGWKIREFHRQMEAAGVAGSSYPNIHRYLKGSREPSLEFLRQSAELLGVRFTWLVVEHGEPTEEAEQSRIEEEAVSGGALLGRRWTIDLSDALEEELGGRVPKVAHAVVAHHWRRLQVIISNIPGMNYSGEDLLRKLAKALVDPLREFDDKGRWTPPTMGALDEQQRGDYLIGIVPAIAIALEHRFRAEGTEILMKTLAIRGLKEGGKDG